MEFNKYISPLGEEKLMEALAKIKHVALDMDGTIYMGSTLFPYTIKFLDTLTAHGISYSFLTNNPTKSHKDYLLKLEKLGIHATDEQMYTSSLATIDYIRQHHPEAKRLFTLGTPSMQEEFVKAGFQLCADDPADRPDLLVVAFDTTLEYSRLCRATWWASKPEIPYIATNPDWVCPTWYGSVPDCGSVCEMLHRATGREPEFIGKPRPAMVRLALEGTGYPPEAAVLLGDRLYTDIACAVNAGIDSVFVLSGEGTRDDIERDGIRPTWVYDDINAVFRAWEETP